MCRYIGKSRSISWIEWSKRIVFFIHLIKLRLVVSKKIGIIFILRRRGSSLWLLQHRVVRASRAFLEIACTVAPQRAAAFHKFHALPAVETGVVVSLRARPVLYPQVDSARGARQPLLEVEPQYGWPPDNHFAEHTRWWTTPRTATQRSFRRARDGTLGGKKLPF
jgi:hypothetical protein